jgi:hypothetical protein
MKILGLWGGHDLPMSLHSSPTAHPVVVYVDSLMDVLPIYGGDSLMDDLPVYGGDSLRDHPTLIFIVILLLCCSGNVTVCCSGKKKDIMSYLNTRKLI